MKRYDKPIELLIEKKSATVSFETISKIEKRLKAAGIQIENISEPETIVSKATFSVILR